ncbi:MAG: DUF5989 family protein [Polyangiales bacterium]
MTATAIARRRKAWTRLASRLRTVGQLVGHFAHRQRFFLAPLLLVLLAAAVLLAATGGLSYVAPFVYAIF